VSLLGVLAAVLTILTAIPAYAEHTRAPEGADGPELTRSPTSPGPAGSLDIDLQLGVNGFRFRSRIFDGDGYAGGVWLDGQARPNGFSLDGRLERDGEAHDFKMNVDIDEALGRRTRWVGRTDL